MKNRSEDYLFLLDFMEESQNNSPLDFAFNLEKLNSLKIF